MPKDAKPIKIQSLRAERPELIERLRTATHLMLFGPSIIATTPEPSTTITDADTTSRKASDADISDADSASRKGPVRASVAAISTGRSCAESAIASLLLKQGKGSIPPIKAVHKISLICGLTSGQSLAALIAIGATHTAPDHDRGHARLASIGAKLKEDHDYAADLRAIVATETMLLIQNERRERAARHEWSKARSADKVAGATRKTITTDAVILRTAIALYFDLDKALFRTAGGAHDQPRDQPREEAGAQRIARWLDDAAVGYCAILQKTESQVLRTPDARPAVELVQNFSGEAPAWAWGYIVALYQGIKDRDNGPQKARSKNPGAGTAEDGSENGSENHGENHGEKTEDADPRKGYTLVIYTPPPRRDHALRNSVAKLLTDINGESPDMTIAENLMAAAIERMRFNGGGLIEAAEALDVLSVRAALVHVIETSHGPIVRIEPAAGRTLRQCRISMAELLLDHNARNNEPPVSMAQTA